jgi:hypothetical protein
MEFHIIALRVIVKVAIVIEASSRQSCNSPFKPQIVMLKAHHKNHNTHETQNSQTVQSSK